MKNPQEISERERRRLKVNQVQQNLLTTRDSETNTAYLKIREQIKSKKKKLTGAPLEEDMAERHLNEFIQEEKELDNPTLSHKQ